MKNLTTLIALLFVLTSNGQKNDPSLRSGQMYSYNPILSGNVNEFLAPEKSIKGSRFIFNEFQEPGKIYIGGKVYSANGLNIDALNKNLVLKVGKDSILVLEKSNIDSIVITNRMFKKLVDQSFYEILFENDDVFLLKAYDCHIKKGHVNVMKGTIENDSYKISKNYHLYQQGKLGPAFELKKKVIINLFEGKRKQVKEYIKKNNLDFKKDEDLISLFKEFYD